MKKQISASFFFLFSYAICIAQSSASAIIPFKQNNKWGFCYNTLDSIVIKPCFDAFESFNDNDIPNPKVYYKVYSSDKVGLVNEKGKLVLDTVYQLLTLFGDDTKGVNAVNLKLGMYAYKNNLMGVFDLSGKILIPIQYESVDLISVDWQNELKNVYQLKLKDSIFILDNYFNPLLRTSFNKNEHPVFRAHYFGYWVYSLNKGGQKWEGLLNSAGKVIIKPMHCGIYPQGIYDREGQPTNTWDKTFVVSVLDKKNKTRYQSLMMNEKGKLGKRFTYIEMNGLSDSLFLVSYKKSDPVIYNLKSNAIVKYNNSKKYYTSFLINDKTTKLYTVAQNTKTAIINETGKIVLPFQSDGVYSLGDMYLLNNFTINEYHFHPDDTTSSSFSNLDSVYYYNTKGEFLFKYDVNTIVTTHVSSKTYFNGTTVMNFKGDTLLDAGKGQFTPLNIYDPDFSSDTLTGIVYDYMKHPYNAYLYKIMDKAILVDSGYVGEFPDLYYKSVFAIATKPLINKPFNFDKIYDKNLNLVFKGSSIERLNFGYVLSNDSLSVSYDHKLKVIAKDTCTFIWQVGYPKPIKQNAHKCLCVIDANTGEKLEGKRYSEYVYGTPYAYWSFRRVKIDNRYYLTNDKFEILHELDDTVTENGAKFWDKYMTNNLFSYPMSIKRAIPILNEAEHIVAFSYNKPHPGFFMTQKGKTYSLYDSLGNLCARNEFNETNAKLTNEFLNLIMNGAFFKADTLHWYTKEGLKKIRINDSIYHRNSIDFQLGKLIKIRRKVIAPQIDYPGYFDLLDLNGNVVYDSIRTDYVFNTMSIILTKDGVYKLIDNTGKVLYEDKKKLVIGIDYNGNGLSSLIRQDNYEYYPGVIVFYFNKDGQPVYAGEKK